ncbi:hypothetical protein ACP4OV_020374 [Aristida adscensionis]
MAPSGDDGAHAMAKQLKVIVPPSLHKMRISDELARCFAGAGDGDDGARTPTALVVSPFGKVWRVEVGRDGECAFLGRGWAEFLAAHGIGVGWFVVLRHEGGGALTVKAFDTCGCIKEFGSPAASVMASRSSKEPFCKPQFIRIIHQRCMEKMIIPAKFVKRYVTEEYLNSAVAIVFSPHGKFWRIELKTDISGMFFSDGWSQFLAFHGISEGDILLLRYEGNMVFKSKVFGLNGCQKDFRNQNIGIQQSIGKQQESSSPIGKRKVDNEMSCSQEKKRQKSSMTYLNKASSQKGSHYQIGPRPWIKKEISTCALERVLSLSSKFCQMIGFQNASTIVLKTAVDSTRSWQVCGSIYSKACYLMGEGWKSFCQENKLKEGDLCTFNVIETTLWHVVITRGINIKRYSKVSPCSSSREPESKNDWTSSEQHKPKFSKNSLKEASSYTKSVYDIGPSSWIQKEITKNSLKNNLETCNIMLKTSINSTRSWQVHGSKQKNSSYKLGTADWKEFFQENKLKVGDICTFYVIKTSLWHVVITRG